MRCGQTGQRPGFIKRNGVGLVFVLGWGSVGPEIREGVGWGYVGFSLV